VPRCLGTGISATISCLDASMPRLPQVAPFVLPLVPLVPPNLGTAPQVPPPLVPPLGTLPQLPVTVSVGATIGCQYASLGCVLVPVPPGARVGSGHGMGHPGRKLYGHIPNFNALSALT
jgi:hypothetical protein